MHTPCSLCACLHDSTTTLDTTCERIILLIISVKLLLRVAVVRLLLLSVLLLARIASTTSSTSIRPAASTVVLARRMARGREIVIHLPASQVDKDPSLICLGAVLQAQLPTDLLHAGFDLLHMPRAVIALTHDDVQVGLVLCARLLDAGLEDILGLLDELAVQVDGVAGHARRGVVLAEDEGRCLLVVRLCSRLVLLPCFGQVMGLGPIAGGVCLVGLGWQSVGLN